MGHPTGQDECDLLAALTNRFVEVAAAELPRASPIQLANAMLMAAAVLLAGLGRGAEASIARWWRRTAPGFFKNTLAMSFPIEPSSTRRH